jgi:hypothetical protein
MPCKRIADGLNALFRDKPQPQEMEFFATIFSRLIGREIVELSVALVS